MRRDPQGKPWRVIDPLVEQLRRQESVEHLRQARAEAQRGERLRRYAADVPVLARWPEERAARQLEARVAPDLREAVRRLVAAAREPGEVGRFQWLQKR